MPTLSRKMSEVVDPAEMLERIRYRNDRLLTRIQSGNLESHSASSAMDVLSPRELQVLRLVADGKTSKEIGGLLSLTEQTVRSYRKTMMKKLGVNNVAALTQLALSNGLTSVARAHGQA